MKRYVAFSLIAVMLAGLNIWSWLAHDGSQSEDHLSDVVSYRPDDFRLKVVAYTPKVTPQKRDLFFAKVSIAAKVDKPVAPTEPPPKTAEQIAEDEAQAEFARMTVSGIAFQGGKGQAYIVRGDESFVVKVGDKIGERYEVRAIARDTVSIRDVQTQIDKQIVLQGN